MTSIAIINKRAPYSTSDGQEALDLALAGGSFGQDISLFFIDDGVFQLLSQQTPECIEQRNFSKTFSALEFYDIENIFVCQQSLASRGLTLDDLCIEVELLDNQALHKQLRSHQHCLSF